MYLLIDPRQVWELQLTTLFLDPKYKEPIAMSVFLKKMRNNDAHLMKLLRELNELIPIKHLEECQDHVNLKNIICIKHCVSGEASLQQSVK